MSKTKSKSSATAASEAIATARAEFDRLNAEVGRLHEQHGAVAGAPPTRDEAIAEMRARIDAEAADGHRRLDQVAEQLARPGGAERWSPAADLERWAAGTGTWVQNKPVLLAVIGDALKAELEQRIQADATFDGDHVVPQAEREKRLAELDRAIAEAEERRDALEVELLAVFGSDEGETETATGGDQGMKGFIARHNEQADATNRELARAGVTQRAQPRVLKAFEPVRRVSVGEE